MWQLYIQGSFLGWQEVSKCCPCLHLRAKQHARSCSGWACQGMQAWWTHNITRLSQLISYETTQEEKPSQQMLRSGLCQLRMLSSQLFSKQTQYRQYPIIISFTFLNRLPVGCFHISHPSNGNIPLHLQVVQHGPYTAVSYTYSSWVLVSTSVSGQLQLSTAGHWFILIAWNCCQRYN